jgi:hypothetical protein
MIDFYFRAEDDPNYIPGLISSTNDIENTITQVRMTLLTRKGEVLGEPEFGLDATKYLFQFEGTDLDSLDKEANDAISEYVMMAKIYNVRAEAFTFDDLADIYKANLGIDITINGRQSFAAFYE